MKCLCYLVKDEIDGFLPGMGNAAFKPIVIFFSKSLIKLGLVSLESHLIIRVVSFFFLVL
uniref:Uncharacterized protein n=1 Tax=Rhizophora mucronata TaxID=61149 RepID=A0A2P2PYD5_RHIMU